MIGLGSPADTMRESDVIVLMVSPLLALRFVIDHNTRRGAKFPRPLHHDGAWTRCNPGIFESWRANCRDIANRRKSDVYGRFFDPPPGRRRPPCALPPHDKPLLGGVFTFSLL